MPDREQDEYELKERERICNLSRDELVREWLDGCSMNELFDIAYQSYMDTDTPDDDELRHMLLQDI